MAKQAAAFILTAGVCVSPLLPVAAHTLLAQNQGVSMYATRHICAQARERRRDSFGGHFCVGPANWFSWIKRWN